MTSLVAQTVKRRVRSLGWEDPPEKEIAIHSRTLAWKIPWTEEPGRLRPMGSQRVEHDWVTSLSLSNNAEELSIDSQVTQVEEGLKSLSSTCFYHYAFGQYNTERNDSYMIKERAAWRQEFLWISQSLNIYQKCCHMDFCTDVERAVAYNPLWLLNNKILDKHQDKYLNTFLVWEIGKSIHISDLYFRKGRWLNNDITSREN